MTHIHLFEDFKKEIKTANIEAAMASNNCVLFALNGQFIGLLSFDEVYYKEIDEDRNQKVIQLMLETFPASENWQIECEKYINVPVFGSNRKISTRHPQTSTDHKLQLAAYKERSGRGPNGLEEGQIQLWDESRLTRSASFGGPFSDVNHTISGTFVASFFFAKNISKKDATKITKIFKDKFTSRQAKSWIDSN